MFFPRRNKPVERQRIFPHVCVNQEGHFGVQLAERGIRRERHLHDVAYAAHVHEHLVRSFFGKPSAELANHRSPVLPLFLRPSTRTRPSTTVFALTPLRGCAEIRRPLRGHAPPQTSRPFSHHWSWRSNQRRFPRACLQSPGGHSRRQ